MAPSSGAVFTLLGNAVKNARIAWAKASAAVETLAVRQAEARLQPIYARITPKHPVHPVAALKQSKGRWYSTHAWIKSGVRNFGTASKAARYDRAAFPATRVGAAISQLPGKARAPFASTLRPNLTGGTLGRTAGGYTLGSGRVRGARYFSHTPDAPAQVVHNVSQAIRAFMVSGQKAQYDGIDPVTHNKRFRAVTPLQDEVTRKMSKIPRTAPGSFIDFSVNPTITALTPLSSVAGFLGDSYAQPIGNSLQTADLLDILSVDFARALKDLALILADLKTLSTLGDLPITYRANCSCLRVQFPGCDADTVESICSELGVSRGVVDQDPEFDDYVGTEIALLFPFAPSKTSSACSFYEKPAEDRQLYQWQTRLPWHDMLSPSRDGSVKDLSTRSNRSLGEEDAFEEIGRVGQSNPWLSSPSGYESVESCHLISEHADQASSLEFQGFEGLHRFMEMCNEPRRY